MPSKYPGALDGLPTDKTNDTTAKDDHAANHNDANAAVNAVQETLGVNPQGDAQDIAERLGTLALASGLETAGMGVVVHGATAGAARPSGYNVVTWIGSVEPENAAEDDIWIEV